MRIPEDVAIVGYNDIPLAGRISPSLTTMHVPIHEFGSVAVGLLLEQIENDEPALRRVRFAPDLVIREFDRAWRGYPFEAGRVPAAPPAEPALTPRNWRRYAREQSFVQLTRDRPAIEGFEMTAGAPDGQTLGWIGVGRMGAVLAARLLEGGCDLSVYNRTSAKAEPLSRPWRSCG